MPGYGLRVDFMVPQQKLAVPVGHDAITQIQKLRMENMDLSLRRLGKKSLTQTARPPQRQRACLELGEEVRSFPQAISQTPQGYPPPGKTP